MRYIIAICLMLLLVTCQQADFHDTQGNTYQYANFAGKWRLVNYWATWCGPCIKEIPELNKLSRDHQAKLLVFGVNYDQPSGAEMQKQVRKMNIEFPVYATEPAASLGIVKPKVLPTTFIFAPDGALHQTLIGPQTEASLLANLDLETSLRR